MADWMPDTTSTNKQSTTGSSLPPASTSTSTSTSTNSTNPSDGPDSHVGALPSIKLPSGGGAISGIGESFTVAATTGTASASIPIPTSSGRSRFGPQLAVSYDSGAGNGPFGFGWQLSLPSITRKTSKGLPLYRDAENSDVFILAGAEDLMLVLSRTADGEWKATQVERFVGKEKFSIATYRPRVDTQFSRIERWTNTGNGDTHWRTISTDNITSVYGEGENSRVSDPKEPSHIFSWLVSRTYDDCGNLMVFEYKAENSQHVDLMKASESRRSPLSRTAARYPKRIRYGNRVSSLRKEKLTANDYMFEVVFDYGDHDLNHPTSAESQPWPARSDPFSFYRPCFEVRTYRLCRRILMFHHFPHEEDIGQDLLVSSVDFSYHDASKISVRENSIASCLSSATKKGYYRRGTAYISQSLPPLELRYSEAKISHEIKTLDPDSLQNIPTGASGPYQWLDLDGEGTSGIITRQGGGYFYKPNLGNGRLGPSGSLPLIPDLFYKPNKGQQWLDLAGNGYVDLVQFDGKTPGFFKRNPSVQGGWEGFKTFLCQPSVSMADPNSILLDLTGDGLADILITDDDIFTWFPGWAEAGFGPARYWRPPLDEDNGPKTLISNGTEMVHSADMSGDGLNDLVRIRNGEVCYWPNLGYGCFGAKVSMDNSPWFDLPDQFRQTRLRLADIDGSGTTDLIYLAADGPRAFLNLSGNGWSNAHHINAFPRIDDSNDIQVLDFLGRGTACLVWSSQLLGDSGRQMRYLDLMNAGKPYLLKSMVNNLGAETHISYSSSTQFYLKDKARGQPWATRLPFPVHVVDRLETLDRISRNRFVTRYSYKHGYYDGIEREFRGFGLVETFDTEDFDVEQSQFLQVASNFDPAFRSPPVLTKTWYHTGAYFEDESMIRQFRTEYYKEPGLSISDIESMSLPETFVPRSIHQGSEEYPYTLSVEEAREAYRSLKGHTLHQEVYALDGSYRQALPYKVTAGSFGIKMFQPRAGNRYAVFFSYSKETADISYERTLYSIGGQKRADPRISHTLVLATDEFGNILRSLSITYGRKYDDASALLKEEDREKQRTPSTTLSLHNYTNVVDQQDSYRSPLPYESLTFEIGNWPRPPVSNSVPLITFPDALNIVQSLSDGHSDVPFQDFLGVTASGNRPFRRLLSHDRVLFRRNDFAGSLPLGQVQSLALPFQSYSQVFTPSLAHDTFVASGKIKSVEALETIFQNSCRFSRFEDDENWWIPSGRSYFSPGTNDTPAEEAAYAQQHFYLPLRHRDPFYSKSFKTESSITYDRYDLLVLDTRDALGNRVTVGKRELDLSKPIQSAFDYRILAPKLVMDANRNCTTSGYDLLGQLTATAVMGKPEEHEGDSLVGVDLFLSEKDVNKYLQDPVFHADSILGDATTRMVYDVWAYYRAKGSEHPPVVAATIKRETHVSSLDPGERSKVQQSFLYSDGFSRAIQTKSLAELDPRTKKPRWRTNGWTIFNNKGSPVRKYEPFFSANNLYEAEAKFGVSSVVFYDPLQRSVATLMPNHTWTKTVFDSWMQEMWDRNDTVLIDPREDLDVGGFFGQLPDTDYLPTWYDARIDGQMGPAQKEAAVKAAVHADTPDSAFLDPLARVIVSVARNKMQRSSDTPKRSEKPEKYISRSIYDISGNTRVNFDSMGRIVQISEVDMINQSIHQASMEGGKKWTLASCLGKPILGWNSRNFQLTLIYDELQRTTETYLHQEAGSKFLVTKVLFGEGQPDPEVHNCRTKAVRSWDQASMSIAGDYDFKGNLLWNCVQYVLDYKTTLDWSLHVPVSSEKYETAFTYDALNRQVTNTTPDGSIIKYRYTKSSQAKEVHARLKGSESWTTYLKHAEYNARNQQTLMKYGNGVQTEYSYDPLTFSLDKLATQRDSKSSPDRNSSREGSAVQNLQYIYDAMLNIVHVEDCAQQTIFFRNQIVKPSSSFVYDALYRLIEATGREHLGQSNRPTPYGPSNRTQTGLQSPGDGKLMSRYTENYFYDSVGNILSLQHSGSDPAQKSWTRQYTYNEPSQIDADVFNNRLSSTRIGHEMQDYRYDGNDGLTGNMTSMSHLHLMCWDYNDRFRASARQHVAEGDVPETTWYSYTGGGQRSRKTTDRHAVSGETPTRKFDHLYQGPFEMYREYTGDGNTISLERTTLHMQANGHRIALVEMTAKKDAAENPGAGYTTLTRYQHGNQLDSSLLELDEKGRIVTYEEYFPFGSTSYQAARSQIESKKRYRYTGKERDSETGLYYHGARYYAPWLGRWTSADPGGLVDGPNLYQYAQNNPIVHSDSTGRQTVKTPPADEGKLMGTADYGKPIPKGVKSTYHNVQRDHPIPVQLRKMQTLGEYNRNLSAKLNERTILVETGKGRFHTEVGKLQREIVKKIESGAIKSESDLWEAVRAAYQTAAKRTGATVDESALDSVLVSNAGTVNSVNRLPDTAQKLETLGPPSSTTQTEAHVEATFTDPHPPSPTTLAPESAAPPAGAAPAEPIVPSSSGATVVERLETGLKTEAKAVGSGSGTLGKIAGALGVLGMAFQVFGIGTELYALSKGEELGTPGTISPGPGSTIVTDINKLPDGYDANVFLLDQLQGGHLVKKGPDVYLDGKLISPSWI